ncbi:MAG: xanthine dehydrogenase family protein subunit M [Armatimonadota bacterium]|nr:xanthine dehydrogenase family protein subunit M [Armatimonadota bacterium]MDR7452307.1 xanthine dehydrogenase family protein subunit M [Armatimonadota bacterium]MDR7467802.1 xanthine dehydrogenase family protein subunit M [Armatimonadota bacterium]MDR7494612.1 xanthine dehydrogenase family protein subunit M [Armatimonadota bacterium]MDR7499672.1 xanthine dehydrogenase family protein subunit M [Armatimonadota bacterium]
MKPAPFLYAAPETLDDAVALVHRYGAEGKVLAGGQSLVPLLNMRLARPRVLVDLNRVRELDYIKDGKEIRIGAMTRQRTAETSPVVRQKLPLLAEAVRCIGHPQIRNRGTIGGSIAHADPAAELPAVLAALDGTVVLQSRRGKRTLRAEAFFLSYLTTAALPDELLVEVRLPAHQHLGTAFLEVARRHGDFALAGVAVALERDGDAVRRVRMAFTGVGATPTRVEEAEEAVLKGGLNDRAFAEAARIVTARLTPDNDIHASAEYRRHVAGVLTERALRLAARRVEGQTSGGRG